MSAKEFFRELQHFHESRGTALKHMPKINGKDVDLYLLYQIVTSHGGWEKVNARNEWDDMLEHFNIPRATNGGLAIKQIYLRNLELYEKIHFLGEDVDGKHEEEDDYDDFRHRRRSLYMKPTNLNQSLNTSQTSSQISLPITEFSRAQYGFSTRLLGSIDYERLTLSLLSPLPNDQDMAISVCTLLSNETKHVLKFPKGPNILDLLLAHAGVFNHCNLRKLISESYSEARGLSHAEFWDETVDDVNIRYLLCECFVERYRDEVGIESDDEEDEEETDIELNELDMTEEEKYSVMLKKRLRDSVLNSCNNDSKESLCCSQCPCGSTSEFLQHFSQNKNLPAFCNLLRKYGSEKASYDKISQRISQISVILRNLSFEEENAALMGRNPTMLRFLLLSSKCRWGSLPQLSLDTFANVAKFVKLKDPLKDPLTSMLLTTVISDLFAEDRFRLLHALESLRELSQVESNIEIIVRYAQKKIYDRICELLTISDIMLLIYTLECILAMTGLGEAICNELCRVQGSVASLISLVTVEAQSYGPKGCILMRVVETVTGNSQSLQNTPGGASGASSTSHSITSSISSSTASTSPTLSMISSSSSNSCISTPNKSTSSSVIKAPVHNVPSANTLSSLSPSSSPPPPSSTLSTLSFINSSSIYTHVSSTSVQSIQPPSLSPSLSISPSISPTPTSQLQFQNSPISNNTNKINTVLSPVISPPSLVQRQQHNSININNINSTTSSTIATTVTTNGPTFINVANQNHLQQQQQPKSISSTNMMSNTNTIKNGVNSVITSLNDTTSLLNNNNNNILTQIVSPSMSTKIGSNEEAWITSWLKETFEPFSGASIEQEELYKLYSTARKNHLALLPTEQFTQCVRNCFGAGVGPALKQFGTTSLTFFTGICSKIAKQQSQSHIMIGQPQPSQKQQPPQTILSSLILKPTSNNSYNSTTAATDNLSILPSSSDSNSNSTARANIPKSPIQNPSTTSTANYNTPSYPSSVHIPSRENKTTSPILKATLSRPPKINASKGQRSSKVVGEKSKTKQNVNQNIKTLSPSSSAIRSLLASKVAQRQQKKLQMQIELPKKNKEEIDVKKGSSKMNGIDGPTEGEESSASSSTRSSESSESSNLIAPLTSFQGVLHNGISSEESSKEGDIINDDANKSPSKMKGMLIDLLERKVNPRDFHMNGLVSGREIRISDRGLELVDKLDENSNSSNNSNVLLASNCGDQDSSQQSMTFYSSSSPVTKNVSSTLTTSSSSPISNSEDSSSQVNFLGLVAQKEATSEESKERKIPPANNSTSFNSFSKTDKVLMSGGGSVSGSVVRTSQGGGQEEAQNNNSNLQGSDLESQKLESAGKTDSSSCKATDNGADFLEKFSQISDLIVFPPEQLGLKRSHAKSNISEGEEFELVPSKRPNLNGSLSGNINNNDTAAVEVNNNFNSSTTTTTNNNNNCIQNSQSLSNHLPPSNNSFNSSTANNSAISSIKSGAVVRTETKNTHSLVLATVPSNSSPQSVPKSTPTQNLTNQQQQQQQQQMVQLPLRIAMNQQNQLSFPRQLVLPSGQQILLSTANSQTSLQGQVIISKSQSSSNDQIPKAIIILQQQQPQQQQQISQISQLNGSSTSSTNCNSAIVGALSSSFSPSPSGVENNSYNQIKNETQEGEQLPYLCEWAGCGKYFATPNKVYLHSVNMHCPVSLIDAVRCEWGVNGCDPLLRKRLSLMTHLQDRHCSKQSLDSALYRRINKIDPPPVIVPSVHHPGYAPNAAFHAIKRHALQFMNPKELLDDNEGPVTKSIRLTSSLILRNLVKHSSAGRRMIRGYESHLSGIAMSNVESSRTISQLLFDLNNTKSKVKPS